MKQTMVETTHFYDGESGKKYRRNATEFPNGSSFPKWSEYNHVTHRWSECEKEKTFDLETAHLDIEDAKK